MLSGRIHQYLRKNPFRVGHRDFAISNHSECYSLVWPCPVAGLWAQPAYYNNPSVAQYCTAFTDARVVPSFRARTENRP